MPHPNALPADLSPGAGIAVASRPGGLMGAYGSLSPGLNCFPRPPTVSYF